MASMTQSPMSLTANLASKPTASDLLRSSSNGFCGIPLKSIGRAQIGAKRREFTITAKKLRKHDYPWGKDVHNLDPNVQGGIFRHISPFKPLKEKPKPVILDFEKPLLDLQKKIIDVQKMANETGLDFSDQIMALENKYQKALKDLYTHLTPYQRVKIARHPHRPTFLDHVYNITESFIELHGDRAGYDDPAIVTGLGSINGRAYMFIGHQKGRNAKENIKRNFGMPTPHGYRKALRMMHYADHHGFPIVTFIDTPGAYADIKSEELNQGEAIAQNLRTMFGLKVPIISIVIGEGGSGGALAIGCANKLLMLENAVFYVASPEACAAILWKTAAAAAQAARKLKITAPELGKLGICDGVIPEPLGGAHTDPYWTSQQIKSAIVDTMDELLKLDIDTLLQRRSRKFKKIGSVDPKKINMRKKARLLAAVDPKKKGNMGNKGKPIVSISRPAETEILAEFKKLKMQISEAVESSTPLPKEKIKQMIGLLRGMIDIEYSEAAKYLRLQDKLLSVKNQVAKASNPRDPSLKKKMDEVSKEFHRRLPLYPNYSSLKAKLDMVTELTNLPKQFSINKKFSEFMDRPDVIERIEAIKVEAANKGVSEPDSDPELKEKMLKLKRELQLEFKGILKSMGLELVPQEKPEASAKSNASDKKSNGSVFASDGKSNGSLVKDKKTKDSQVKVNLEATRSFL